MLGRADITLRGFINKNDIIILKKIKFLFIENFFFFLYILLKKIEYCFKGLLKINIYYIKGKK